MTRITGAGSTVRGTLTTVPVKSWVSAIATLQAPALAKQSMVGRPTGATVAGTLKAVLKTPLVSM